MSIVFGPVHSRRFGKSLGIDLSPNEKCCNFDCLYCELSSKTPTNIIKNPPAIADIIKELKSALIKFDDIDEITITANGEPTLYENLSDLIDEIRKISDKKILILSNGSGVLKKDVFDILLKIDVVKFSIDSANEKTFKKIDRCLKNIKAQDIIKNIIAFSKEFKGELILEILVLSGINDSDEEFKLLNDVIKKIAPLRVDISTLDRPPAYKVDRVSFKRLYELRNLLEFDNVNIASRKFDDEKFEFSQDEILNLIKLRPQSIEDIEHNFSDKSKKIVKNLILKGAITKIKLAGVGFYKIANS